jgi:hypothetical protein
MLTSLERHSNASVYSSTRTARVFAEEFQLFEKFSVMPGSAWGPMGAVVLSEAVLTKVLIHDG